MIKISKIPKFSLNTAKGSVETRYKKAAEMTDAFFNEIKDEFVNGQISIKQIRKKIHKLVPEKKVVKVVENTDESCAGRVDLCKNKGSGKSFYKIALSLDNSTKKIDVLDIDVITHESFHLFSRLFNPKMSALDAHCTNKYNAKDIGEFYDSNLYNKSFKPRACKEKINSFLKDKSVKEKVDILQNYRYGLEDERRAYKIGDTYVEKILETMPEMLEQQKNGALFFIFTGGKEYNFPKKIKLIEKMLAKIIKNERLAHAKSLKQ